MIKFNLKDVYKIYKNGSVVNKINAEVDTTPTSRLPEGYTEVEYIRQSSSTIRHNSSNKWTVPINNMVSGDSFTIIFSMDSTGQNGVSRYISIFGSDEVFAIRQDSGYGYNLNTKYFTNANTARGNYTMEYDTKLSFNYKPSLITVTNVTTGVQTLVNLSQSSGYNPSGELGVYGYWYGGTGEYLMKGNVYEIKIEGTDETIKYNYIPCKRDSDNKVGLYDIVNNVFASPSGFTITAGQEVTPTGTTSESKVVFQYVTSGDTPTPPTPVDYSTQYTTFVAESDNVTFSLYGGGSASNTFQYSTDSGTTWNNVTIGQTTSAINTGEKMMFKASGLTVGQETGIGTIRPSGNASVEGNIMSLVYGDNFSGQTTIPANFQFRKLFSGATHITNAENMIVTASSFPKQCYSQMFQGCSSLVKAPKTVGTSASTFSGDYCFSDMFANCSAMTVAPELPMTTLGTQCYWYMIQGCTSLTQAPLLPAPSINTQSYCGLFYGCTNLESVTCLATAGISTSNCNEWMKNVQTTSGIFTKAASATWSRGQNAVPNNWTIVDYSA